MNKITIQKKLLTRILVLFPIIGFVLLVLPAKLYAAELLPKPIEELMNVLGREGEGTSEFAAARIRLLLIIGLGGLILAAVIYAGLAALKYIRSQGDPTQVEEAGKAIKAIFLGLAVLLISIIGIVLIFVFFGVELFRTETHQVCLSAPGSEGCVACQHPQGGLDKNWENIKFDDSARFDSGLMAEPTNDRKKLCTQCEWQYYKRSKNSNVALSAVCRE